MDKDKSSIERTVLRVGSMLTAVVALFAGINSVFDQVRKTVGVLMGFDKWQLGVAALALVTFSLWLFRLSRRRRSVLLRPEALRLERANPAHLIGRVQDIDQLARLCREQSLVFLEGESGAGKSALLQAGLVPALKGDAELLPIYVESLVGADWERDPRRFLAAALWTALDDASKAVLELKAVPAPGAIRAVIEAIPSRLGRAPLLVLDQFDDYQTRHRERFLPRKTWLKPGKLAEQNGFWRDMRDLLASHTIHMIVVTRTDTASGLTSVRFTEPETYRLDRLSSHFVGQLLAELAKEKDEQPVIGDPEYGWTMLLARLSADLERAGTILPQQIKIVLAGLGTLPGRVLTIASYELAGGASGLEARFIEDRVAKVARLYGVTEERVRTALLTLVDPESGQKTVERRNDELLSCIDPAALEKAQRALNLLSQEEVIRRRIDPGTGESSWLLDHDYLTRAVREVDRRANRWQRAFAEGAKALADAGNSWPRRWRALLPPRTQLAFLYDRLRGRFRYNKHRLYAINSLQRLGPYIAVPLLVVGLGLYEGERRSEERIQNSADNILNGLEFQLNGITESEAEALLRLASAEEPVRQFALTQVLTNPDRARVFIRQPEVVIRAIVGLSARFRALVSASLASTTPFSASNRRETSMASIYLARSLGQTAVLPAWWVVATKDTTDPSALASLSERLTALPAKLTDSQAKDAVEPFLAAIKTTTDDSAKRLLGAGLRALSATLTDSQAKEAVEPLLAAIETTADPDALQALGEALGALPAKLTDSQAKDAVEPFLAAIKTTADLHALQALGKGLGALPAKLTDSQAKEAVERFLAAIEVTTDPNAFWSLRAGLKALSAKLTDSQAQDAVEPFIAAIKGATSPNVLSLLGAALGALPAKLGDNEVKDAVEPFLAAMKGTTDPDALANLGSGLGALPAKLTDSQAKEAVAPFLAAMRGTTDLNALTELAGGLGALPTKLTDTQARESVASFFAAVKTRDFSKKLSGSVVTSWGNGLIVVSGGGTKLGALTAKFTASQAKDAVEPFLAAIMDNTDPYALWTLGSGLGALPAKLTDSQAKKAVQPFLAAINVTTDTSRLQVLGAGLAAFSTKLTDSQAKELIGPFLAAIKGTANPYGLWALGEGVRTLSSKLDANSAKAAAVVANEVVGKTRNRETAATYIELSALLAHHLPREQQVVRIFHDLRNPLTAGEPTKNLLTVLEHVQGVEAAGFSGDLWKAVEWVEAEQNAGRLSGLDLDAPLQVPVMGLQAFLPASPH
jgi:hypothetical protein